MSKDRDSRVDRANLVEKLLRARGVVRQQSSATTAKVIPRRAAAERAPLSFAQERYWFVRQAGAGTGVDNIVGVIRLRGTLDIAAFRKSVNTVIAAHQSLRTTIQEVDGVPHQLIASTLNIDVPVLDAAMFAGNDDEVVQRLSNEEAGSPFDLHQGPLIRARLLQLGAKEHVLALGLHHIIADGWSVSIIAHEIATCYAAFCVDAPNPLPTRQIHYADFAEWQRRELSGPEAKRDDEFWTSYLRGAPPVLALPRDRVTPKQSLESVAIDIVLSPGLTREIASACRTTRATPHMLVMAGFKLLLARQTGLSDVVVGVPVTNREFEEGDRMVGLLVNTVPVRTEFSAARTFQELVESVRRSALEAYAHQLTPFERIVEVINPIRDSNTHPIFQVLVNGLQFPRRVPGMLGGVTADFLNAPSQVRENRYELELYFQEDEGQISLRLVHRKDAYESARMTHMLEQLEFVLTQGASEPRVPLDSISLVTPSMRSTLPDPHRLLEAIEYPPITRLVERTVARDATAVAVEQGHRTWSYRELWHSAETIADALVAGGITHSEVIGVTGARSFGLIASMLGVMLAGGVLLTIDPRLPPTRQRLMLSEAHARRLVVVGLGTDDIERPFSRDALVTYFVDGSAGGITPGPPRSPSREPRHHPRSADPAYIFFTSGTTGKPKGVLGWHGALTHFVSWQIAEFGIGPGDRAAQLTGLSFNVLLRDVFTPLCAGATLCLLDADSDVADGSVLLPWLAARSISVIHTVPSLAEAWLASKDAAVALTHLRWVFFAGEPLTEALVRKWRATISALKAGLVVLYGSTEQTLAKFFLRVPTPPLSGVQAPSNPLPNTQALILQGTRLCGVSEIGEIVVRTPYLTRGYINAPEDNDAKFVPNPANAEQGDLVYRTGDLARYRRDGSFEIIGRADHQVKINGVRVDPAEVTGVLVSHPDLASGVATVTTTEGHATLVAYVTPKASGGDAAALVASVMAYMRGVLPSACLPSRCMVLERLPLNASGKVDRSALPPFPPLEATRAQRPARNERETLLLAIWTAVLQKPVGVDDNFFEVGGHSLLAMQVASRIRKALQVDVDIRDLFEFPTVEALAERLASSPRAVEQTMRPRRVGPAPLSFAQERMWFLSRLDPAGAAYNNAYALAVDGHLDAEALASCVDTMIERHESLRTSFRDGADSPEQCIHDALHLDLAFQDLRTFPEEGRQARARAAATADACAAFDLGSAPLMRIRLLRLDEHQHVLAVTIHHIVSDGWSVGVLVRELLELYVARTTQRAAQLPPLTMQYADYAVLQRESLQGDRLSSEVEFWKCALLDYPMVLPLPTDRSRPAVQTFAGATLVRLLPKIVAEAVQQVARRFGATEFMVLLAVYALVLGRYSNQRKVIIGTPSANRTLRDTEALIGFFVNTLAIGVDVEASSFEMLLGRVKERAVAAYQHQELPFEKLVEHLRPERDTSRSPIFQAMFVLQHAFAGALTLPGLSLRPLELSVAVAKFDVTLEMRPIGDGYEVRWEYNTDLFESATIGRFASSFEILLHGALARPASTPQQLYELIAEQEAPALLALNASAVRHGAGSFIHELIEEQARRTPDATAVVFENQRLSYGDLERRARNVAAVLQSLGVGHESPVAVMVERSLEMVIALLAVLKAGGMYVPIDPGYPKARIEYMLQDSGARWLLSTTALSRAFAGTLACQTVELGDDLERKPRHFVRRRVCADGLAYAIYTSGSSGRPKCAALTHRNLANHMLWMQSRFPLTEQSVVLQKTPFSFDASVWEFYAPLLVGARLVMARPEGHMDPTYMCQLIRREGVTTLQLVPAMLDVLLLEPSLASCTSLERIFCGGEVLRAEHCEALRATLPSAELVNLYGPTETTIDATFYVCGGPKSATMPIGRPISNMRCFVLDGDLRRVPIGAPGELFVAGEGVGRGYLGHSDITADRYLPNPYAIAPGERMYRTGDVVRILPDGELDFVGRADHQRKLRGFRIELGEIEGIIRRLTGTSEAVVLIREDVAGEPRLVAYVMAAVPDAQLREKLRRELPEYMVPGTIVTLPLLPRTPNGKIDRGSLPAPESAGRTESPYEVPSDDTEVLVSMIWAEVLRVPKVGRSDNFFDLGGHSLLALQVHRRLVQALKREIPVVELFRYPTVRDLASYLTSLSRERATDNFERGLSREQVLKRQAERRVQRKKRGTE